MNTPLPPADGPWQWRNFGQGWTLTTRDGGAQVVLDCQATWTTREPLTCRLRTRDPATGLIVELTPESNAAKRIEATPLLEEAVRALMARFQHALKCLEGEGYPYTIDDDDALLMGRRALGLEGER